MILPIVKQSHSLVCMLIFSQVTEVEVKTISVYHCAAYLIYATAHKKQFLVSIFMPCIDFYEYHENKKLLVLSALLPTHTYPHNTFKSNLPWRM